MNKSYLIIITFLIGTIVTSFIHLKMFLIGYKKGKNGIKLK